MITKISDLTNSTFSIVLYLASDDWSGIKILSTDSVAYYLLLPFSSSGLSWKYSFVRQSRSPLLHCMVCELFETTSQKEKFL